MSNANLVTITGEPAGTIKLPIQFEEEIRADIITRAVHSIWSNKRQIYGTDPRAGKKTSAKLSRRRRDYKGSYGKGISRVPRKTMLHRGTQFQWKGAFAPGMVGGRKAHPPTTAKQWERKINDAERRKAIRSAIAGSINSQLAQQRGHKIPKNYPMIIKDEIEQITTTKALQQILEKLGFEQELQRTQQTKKTTGKAKRRGRAKKVKIGLLIVTAKNSPVAKAAQNILGVAVTPVEQLNAEILAPAGIPGRITIYTAGAIQRLEKEKLFL